MKVRNFKGIAKLDLPLDHSLTLLAGINGVGKTSAIEALLGAVTGDLVRYGVRMDRVLFLRKDGGFDIPFEFLSGGEQAYFLLAVDLARRLIL